MEKEFYIIKFPNEQDAIAVVPALWIEDKICYWPPSLSNTSSLAKKKAQPVKKTWEKHVFEVIQGFGKFYTIFYNFFVKI
jgi:hypothetical protein